MRLATKIGAALAALAAAQAIGFGLIFLGGIAEVSDDGAEGAARDLNDLLPSRGLGLRIAREVARAHGGEVRLEREGDRTRATLTLTSSAT